MKHRHQLLMIILSTALFSPLAQAHDNSAATGLMAGLSHPLTGLDHLAALMLAGLLIGRLAAGRGQALGCMLLTLALGAGSAVLLGAQAWMESIVLLSIPVFIALQWIKRNGQMKIAVVIMSFFMFAHGWVHGVDMGGMNASFIFGLLLTSALIMSLAGLLGAALRSRMIAAGHA